MKKIFLLILSIFLISLNSFAQSWNWINYSENGDPQTDHICASDDMGNCYVNDGSISIDKFDSKGNFLWRSIIDSSSNSYPYAFSLAIYPGYAYLGGTFLGKVLMGKDSLKSPASTDIYIAKINSNGVFQWAKAAKPIGFSLTLKSIACDKTGNVFATGTFSDTAVFDHDTLKGQYGAIPSFLVKYDANGNVLWAKENRVINSVDEVQPTSIAVDKLGNAYVTGDYDGTPILGNDTLPRPPSFNLFIAKYAPNGNVLWVSVAQTPKGTGSSTGTSVSVDRKGNSYVGGAFWSGTLALGHSTFGPVASGTPF